MKTKKTNTDPAGKLLLYGLISFCIGVPSFFIALPQTQNYLQPHLFLFSSGLLGFIVALIISLQFKKRPSKDPTDTFIRYFSRIILSMGCIGIFVLATLTINNTTSKIEACKDFVVIDKRHSPVRYHKQEKNCIYVIINHKKWEFLSTYKFWTTISINQKVTICQNTSYLGFDYLSLKEN